MQPIRGVLDTEHTEKPVRPPRPRWLFALGLAGLCLLVYVPGFFTIPPVDRDESRFAQASRQMFESVALPAAQRDPKLHSGGLAIPMVQDRPRLNKPPLIYWLQAASAAVFTGGLPDRDAIWMYRVPSLLAAIAAAFLTWRLGASMFGEAVGRLAGMLLAVCPILAWESHQARADMVLLAFTTATLSALWHIYSRIELSRTAPTPALRAPLLIAVSFWLSLAAAIMTKGPIAPMIAALTAGAIGLATRRWKWIRATRPLLGIVIVVAAVAPWLYAAGSAIGWYTYLSTILDETLGRSVSAKEGHWGPPGYHLVLLPVLLWPGSLLTAVGVTLAWKLRRAAPPLPTDTPRPSLLSRFASSLPSLPSPDHFCLAWIIPSWLIFEIVSTKLPHYTLPLYPPLAILGARAVLAAGSALLPQLGRGSNRTGLTVWFTIGLVPMLGAIAFLGFYTYRFFELYLRERTLAALVPSIAVFIAVVVSAIPLLVLLSAYRFGCRGNWPRAQHRSILAAALCFALAFHTIAPVTAPGTLTEPLARGILDHLPSASRPIASTYHEDSLIFHLRGRVERIEPEQAEPWLNAHPRGIVIVPAGSLLLARADITVISTLPASRIMESAPRYYALRRVDAAATP